MLCDKMLHFIGDNWFSIRMRKRYYPPLPLETSAQPSLYRSDTKCIGHSTACDSVQSTIMHPFFDQFFQYGNNTRCEDRSWFSAILNFLAVVLPLTWIALTYMGLSAVPVRITTWVLLYIVLEQICSEFLCMHSSLAFTLPTVVLYLGSLVSSLLYLASTPPDVALH